MWPPRSTQSQTGRLVTDRSSVKLLYLALRRDLSTLLKPQVLAITLFLMLADLMLGTVGPTFSLFARSLGASLTWVGVLATSVGLTRLVAGMAVGGLSDRWGRRRILTAGMLLLGIAYLLYSLLASPQSLLLAHIVQGVGFVSTFTVGLAYATDLVAPRQRSLLLGVVGTLGGLGYAVGSWLGGSLAGSIGYRLTYRMAAGVALLGLWLAWRGMGPSGARTRRADAARYPLHVQLGAIAGNGLIMSACLASMVMNVVFGGLVIVFFPIHASALGITQTLIGSMLAIRALASVIARLPTGLLARRIPSEKLLLVALSGATLAALALPRAAHALSLTLLLIIEGVAFGTSLVAGQATVVEHAGESDRGGALGIYGAAGSLADTLSPLLLGVVAEHMGLRAVFTVTGVIAALGTLAMLRTVVARSRAGAHPERSTDH